MVAQVVAAAVGEVDGFDLAHEQAKMSDEAARAFTYWLGLPERNLATVATHTGKSHDMVRQWSSIYGWRELARRYDLAVSSMLMVQLRSTLVVEGFRSIKTAVEIRDKETAKDGDRLKAAFWLAGLTGIGSQLAGGDDELSRGISADDLRRMATSGNPDDLRRLVDLTTGRDDR